MSARTLATAVAGLTRAFGGFSDGVLGREWPEAPGDGVWREYRDNAREVIFQVYLELRQMAAATERARSLHGPPVTEAHHLLTRHQQAYRDLCGVLAAAREDEVDRVPREGEWPLRRAIDHLAFAEGWGFYPQVMHAVARYRAGDLSPDSLPIAEVQARYGDGFDSTGDLADLLARFDEMHGRVVRDCAEFSDDELDALSRWWEGYPVPVRFRLARFDAHLREHTVQIEKTLAWLDHPPSEAERLAQLLYGALGDVEGAMIGAPDADERQRDLAATVARRVAALTALT